MSQLKWLHFLNVAIVIAFLYTKTSASPLSSTPNTINIPSTVLNSVSTDAEDLSPLSPLHSHSKLNRRRNDDPGTNNQQIGPVDNSPESIMKAYGKALTNSKEIIAGYEHTPDHLQEAQTIKFGASHKEVMGLERRYRWLKQLEWRGPGKEVPVRYRGY